MKYFTFLLAMLTFTYGYSQNSFPIDFESGDVAVENFDGGVLTTIDNPQSDANNSSSKVGQMVKGAGEIWAGSKILRTETFSFTTNQLFKMKVFSNVAGVPVIFKLEKSDTHTVAVEKTATTSKVGEWETLEFDFNGSDSDIYTHITLIFGFGTVGDGSADWTFLIDDITFEPSSSTLASLPLDFEVGDYEFEDFDGGAATVIDNPQSSGDNTSTKVAQIVRDGGATWAGSKILLGSKIDFSTESTFTMKVFSPRVGVPVLFKLEGSGAATEKSVNTTKAGEWETLTWDFTGEDSDKYNYLVFMFDFGAVGDGTANSTFLFDDVMLIDGNNGKTRVNLPVDYQSSTVAYNLTDFGGNSTVIGEDPTDPSNMVAITTKTDASETWAGTTIGGNPGFETAIPFTETKTGISMKVYSPSVGVPIRLKVEDSNDNTLTAETEVNTTVANQWETLTFDLSNVVDGTNPFDLNTNFDKLSVFFNFGTVGTGLVYYWDELKLVEGALSTDVISDKAKNVNVFSVNERISINNLEELRGGKIEVYGITGRIYASQNISNLNESINLNSKGIFVVVIFDKHNNKVLTSKIIK